MHSKLETKKPKLLWLQGLTCNGNTHSFLNLNSLDTLLEQFEILYFPAFATDYTYEDILTCKLSCDVLIFEGTYDSTLQRGGILLADVLQHYAKSAKYIIGAGTCASFGGMFAEMNPQNKSGLLFKKGEWVTTFEMYKEKIINLSGCPMHPEWMAYTLQMILHHKTILLDELYRPQELYGYLSHHGCTRNEYFEWKVDAKNFGTKEGCLFYEQGCRGPMTHASCNKILWNEVSSKTRIGTPCLGCTESDFPRTHFFTTKTNMSIPQDIPFDVPKRSYLTMVGIAKTFHIKRLEGKLIDYKTTH
jgi:hydrogenase small subunit